MKGQTLNKTKMCIIPILACGSRSSGYERDDDEMICEKMFSACVYIMHVFLPVSGYYARSLGNINYTHAPTA